MKITFVGFLGKSFTDDLFVLSLQGYLYIFKATYIEQQGNDFSLPYV